MFNLNFIYRNCQEDIIKALKNALFLDEYWIFYLIVFLIMFVKFRIASYFFIKEKAILNMKK
jgi:hypothetical protein